MRDPILNQLQYFHTTEGLVPDIMHDILEGVLPMCVKHLLSHLLQTSVITVDELNRRIDTFNFGAVEGSNRPRGTISATHLNTGELRQSGNEYYILLCHACMCFTWWVSPFCLTSGQNAATEMWCLGRFLPLIVADLIAEDSTHWLHFLQLLTIMEYLFAPVTSNDNMKYVEILIEDFLSTWQQLYPSRTLTPKMHYLLHLPAWMAR